MDRLLFTPLGGYEPPHVKIILHGQVPSVVPTIAITNSASLLIARHAKYARELQAGSAEMRDIVLYARGDIDECMLVLLGAVNEDQDDTLIIRDSSRLIAGEAESASPELGEIAVFVTKGLSIIDNECAFVRKASGKWMNKGVNFFTLKVQPSKNNIHFTIYGNPWSFDHHGFLRKDQNSYSRGWIKTLEDAEIFLRLARESHSRRVLR